MAEWPDDLLRFVGYAKTANALGYLRDSEDPLVAVHPDLEFPRGWATVRPDSRPVRGVLAGSQSNERAAALS